MKATDEVFVCQVTNPDVFLPCEVKIGPFRCEILEPHNDNHWVGEHTSKHSLLGASTPCSTVSKSSKEPKKSKLSPLKIILVGIACMGIAFGAAFAVHQGRLALNESEIFYNQSGNITVLNDTLQAFTGQTIESTNASQKALGTQNSTTKPPAIIFSNGVEAEARKDVHFYMDFGDKESRDLILLNQSTLLSLVESGRINLYLHPVPSGDPFSIYGAEALAEAAALDPERTWQALLSILKTADLVLAKEMPTNRIADAIAKSAEDAGVDGINRESIQNGSFVSWLLSVASDPLLASGTKLPSVFIGTSPVSLPSLNLTDNNEFYNLLEEGPNG